MRSFCAAGVWRVSSGTGFGGSASRWRSGSFAIVPLAAADPPRGPARARPPCGSGAPLVSLVRAGPLRRCHRPAARALDRPRQRSDGEAGGARRWPCRCWRRRPPSCCSAAGSFRWALPRGWCQGPSCWAFYGSFFVVGVLLARHPGGRGRGGQTTLADRRHRSGGARRRSCCWTRPRSGRDLPSMAPGRAVAGWCCSACSPGRRSSACVGWASACSPPSARPSATSPTRPTGSS